MHEMTFRFKRAHLRSVELGKRLCGRFGLTPARFDILYVIKLHAGACSQGAIIRALGLSKRTVSKMLKRMAALDLVSRRKSLADNRALDVALTKTGFEAVASAAAYFFRGNALRELFDTMHYRGRALVEEAAQSAGCIARGLADFSTLEYPTERPPVEILEANNLANVAMHARLCEEDEQLRAAKAAGSRAASPANEPRTDAGVERDADGGVEHDATTRDDEVDDPGRNESESRRTAYRAPRFADFRPPAIIYGPLVRSEADAHTARMRRIDSRSGLSAEEMVKERIRLEQLEDDLTLDRGRPPRRSKPMQPKTSPKREQAEPRLTPESTASSAGTVLPPEAEPASVAYPEHDAHPDEGADALELHREMLTQLGDRTAPEDYGRGPIPGWITGAKSWRPSDAPSDSAPLPIIPPPEKLQLRLTVPKDLPWEAADEAGGEPPAPDDGTSGVERVPRRRRPVKARDTDIAQPKRERTAPPSAGLPSWFEKPIPLPKVEEFDVPSSPEEAESMPSWMRAYLAATEQRED